MLLVGLGLTVMASCLHRSGRLQDTTHVPSARGTSAPCRLSRCKPHPRSSPLQVQHDVAQQGQAGRQGPGLPVNGLPARKRCCAFVAAPTCAVSHLR